MFILGVQVRSSGFSRWPIIGAGKKPKGSTTNLVVQLLQRDRVLENVDHVTKVDDVGLDS